MSIFETVKATVTTRMAAEHYGLKVERNGLTCCPFHGDKHPSMKLDDRYYCFGCHETGDVIDFTAKLFGLPPMEAAKKLASDFGIDPLTPAVADVKVQPVPSEDKRRRMQLLNCMTVMIDYECFLKEQKGRYAPTSPNGAWNSRFAAACNSLPYVTYTIDCLFDADEAARARMTDELIDSGIVEAIRSFLSKQEDMQPLNTQELHKEMRC